MASSFKFSKKTKIVAAILVVLLLLVVTAVKNINKQENQNDFIEFIDVGQGDSALIYSNGYTALIDTGTPNSATSISKTLKGYNIDNLDVIILSHPHDDHIGSAEFVLEEFGADNIIFSDILPADDDNAAALKNIKDTAEYVGAECHYAKEGMVINIGNFKLTVLFSDENAEDENNMSIVLMAENDGNKFLFTGDAEKDFVRKIIEQNFYIDCDVLKVGHHGSRTSTSQELLNIATPRYSIISCGIDNSYGHPHDAVVKRLQNTGTTILRTDKKGNITCKIVNGKIVIE